MVASTHCVIALGEISLLCCNSLQTAKLMIFIRLTHVGMAGADGSTADGQADDPPDIHVLLFGENTAGPEQIKTIKVAAAALSHSHTLLLCQWHHATTTIVKSCMRRSIGSCAMARFDIASLQCRCQALELHLPVAERHLPTEASVSAHGPPDLEGQWLPRHFTSCLIIGKHTVCNHATSLVGQDRAADSLFLMQR